ncbi:MAG: SDR family NAD(P)-dependent oxidoreductase [Prosthecobacter sp.]
MNLSGQTCLVTGGAGFIGSELCRQLLAAGAQVRIVDNLVNGKESNVAEILGHSCTLHTTDIRDVEAMRALIQGCDRVFHLACLGVRHSIHSPVENHEVNATATLNLLLLSRELGVVRFVYVSSSEVYGTAQQVPQPETHPTLPMTVYGASKLAGECYTRAFYRTYDYATTVIRPFNSYGPRSHHEGDSGEVIPKFLLRTLAGRPMVIFGDGSQTRDFTFVSDTARGILEAGLADNTIGETINIGSGFEITIKELADEVRTVTGMADAAIIHESDRPGDVLRLYSDTTKARELTGFAPQVTLREGLTKLLGWYQAQGLQPEELLQNEIVKNWEVKA